MTAGNNVITGQLEQPAPAGENGYCGFTQFLEIHFNKPGHNLFNLLLFLGLCIVDFTQLFMGL